MLGYRRSCQRRSPYLLAQLFVHGYVSVWPIEGLFQKRQENGDDNGDLHSLAKDHEKDRDGKDSDRHLVFARAHERLMKSQLIYRITDSSGVVVILLSVAEYDLLAHQFLYGLGEHGQSVGLFPSRTRTWVRKAKRR